MMLFLSKALSALVGPLAGTVLVPGLILGVIVLLHQNYQQRQEKAEKKIEVAATTQCNAVWRLAISKNRERAALAEVAQAQELIRGEREVNERLSNELEKARTDLEQVRSTASSTDTRCLSDGVLEHLGRRQNLGTGVNPGTGR